MFFKIRHFLRFSIYLYHKISDQIRTVGSLDVRPRVYFGGLSESTVDKLKTVRVRICHGGRESSGRSRSLFTAAVLTGNSSSSFSPQFLSPPGSSSIAAAAGPSFPATVAAGQSSLSLGVKRKHHYTRWGLEARTPSNIGGPNPNL